MREPDYRLAIVGDSFAFGNGVEECETYAALIAEARPRVQVSNLGMVGAGFQQYLRVIEQDVCGRGYDGVALLVFGNDFLDVNHPVNTMAKKSAFVWLVTRALENTMPPQMEPPAPPAGVHGVDPSLLKIGEEYGSDPFYYPILVDLLTDEDAYLHMSHPPEGFAASNLAVLDEVLKTLHECVGDVWVAVVPNGAAIDEPMRRYIQEHHGSLPPQGKTGWVYETVRGRTLRTGGLFVETFDAFRASADRNYYESDPHWTASGHRLFATLLLEVLPDP